MAIKYYPEDKKNSGTLAIKLPTNSQKGTSNSGLFNMSYSTEEQSISNYINLLLTRRGERYMQPEFGIGIQEKIFEQNTEFLQTIIEQEIAQQSAQWLPYIVNKSIVVQNPKDIPGLGDQLDHAIQIIITFSVHESGANRTISIFGLGGKITYEVI